VPSLSSVVRAIFITALLATCFAAFGRSLFPAAAPAPQAPTVPLVQLNPTTYMTEHAVFLIADPASVSFPDWFSVYSQANIDSYVAQLKSLFPDDYFMVAVLANNLTPNSVPTVVNTLRHNADGIGLGTGPPSTGVANICKYNLGGGSVLLGAIAVFDHEIGHNWSAFVGSEVAAGHWYSNTTVNGQMSTSYSDDNFTTVKEISGDPVNGFTWTAINNLTRNETETFADQDLYLMGLNPTFPDTYVLAQPVYNADLTMSYTSVAKYDHAWIVGKHGPRVPNYQNSDKQFRIGFVYVAHDLSEIQSVYSQVERSIDSFENGEAVDLNYRFQVPFLVETKYRASIRARLADLDGNATPSLTVGNSYAVSTNGTATIPFTASDPDGPSPTVSLVPASGNATINNGTVSLQGLAPGTYFFTIKAEDTAGKKAFAHVVVDVLKKVRGQITSVN
jgi:hypothetical protein